MNTFIKKYAILVWACLTVMSLSSCFRLIKKIEPSENIVSHEYNLKGFESAIVLNNVVLHFSEGEDYSVKAEGPENMMAKLRCEVTKGKNLKVEIKKGEKFAAYTDDQKVHVWVTAPQVYRFVGMSDSKILCDTLTQAKNVAVETFNGSEFVCDSIQAGNLSVSAHNGSTVIIDSCQSDIVAASAFNSGSIKMKGKVKNTMSLEAHNSAEISFKGEATTVNANAFNSSDIELEGTFQNKNVSEFNGAHIKIGQMEIYLSRDSD